MMSALGHNRTHAVQQTSCWITSSVIASSVVRWLRPQQSRMWTPRRRCQQLDLLCHDKRSELRGKTFHEVLVGEDPRPVLPPIGVVIKLPEMDELVDRASVGLEVAHELLVMTALLERREAELLVELRRWGAKSSSTLARPRAGRGHPSRGG